MRPRPHHARSRQRGLSAVEFAVVGAAVFMLLFGVIEVARAAFARTMLGEGIRRAARLAAVCPVNDPYIINAARFEEKNWGARLIPNLAARNVSLQYLDINGAVIADPATDFTSIRFARVTVAGYAIPLFMPYIDFTYQPGPVSSTQPAESLGVSPTEIRPCLPTP
ncbi:MAG: pilus assembly protein [Gemmatimonadaceae bacterium]|nr:pilus assembly protein [Gemmatimonadaceae bacterium]